MDSTSSNDLELLKSIRLFSEEEQFNLIQRWYLNALQLYSEKAIDEEFGRLEW